jgi:hypothetical protein
MLKQMSFGSRSLLVFSAVLYPLPFYFSKTLFWVSFLYLVPLFYVGVHYRVSLREGYIWGLITLLGHEFGVFTGLFTMAEGAYSARMVPIFFLVVFRAIFPAVWLFIVGTCMRMCRHCTSITRLMAWVMSAWLYELWMDYYHLSLFGNWEGYLLLNPLIPLAEYPKLLWMLPLLHIPGLLLYLFICSGVWTYAIISKKPQSCFVAVLVCIPWAAGYLKHDRARVYPSWLSSIGALQHKFFTYPEGPAITFLQKDCATLKQRYPEVTCVICPESCIYETDLPLSLRIYAGNYDNILESLQLVIGGFYNEEGRAENHRNTAYFADHNKTLHLFYKRHAMALTERMPQWLDSAVIRDLYFNRRPQVAASRNVRPIWLLAGKPMSPYICSELFFNKHPDDAYAGITILAMCNDYWAPPSVGYLMYLGAQLRAREWGRNILYVSYRYAVYITKNGEIYPLRTLGE